MQLSLKEVELDLLCLLFFISTAIQSSSLTRELMSQSFITRALSLQLQHYLQRLKRPAPIYIRIRDCRSEPKVFFHQSSLFRVKKAPRRFVSLKNIKMDIFTTTFATSLIISIAVFYALKTLSAKNYGGIPGPKRRFLHDNSSQLGNLGSNLGSNSANGLSSMENYFTSNWAWNILFLLIVGRPLRKSLTSSLPKLLSKARLWEKRQLYMVNAWYVRFFQDNIFCPIILWAAAVKLVNTTVLCPDEGRKRRRYICEIGLLLSWCCSQSFLKILSVIFGLYKSMYSTNFEWQPLGHHAIWAQLEKYAIHHPQTAHGEVSIDAYPQPGIRGYTAVVRSPRQQLGSQAVLCTRSKISHFRYVRDLQTLYFMEAPLFSDASLPQIVILTSIYGIRISSEVRKKRPDLKQDMILINVFRTMKEFEQSAKSWKNSQRRQHQALS